MAYVDLNADLTALEDGRRLDAETIVELTYEFPVNELFESSFAALDTLALQPDLQYIMKPGGDPNLDDALVVGLRGKIGLQF